MQHVEHLLRNCIRYSQQLQNVTVVLLSIWFHDVVYDATRNDNELRSVEVFKMFARHLEANVQLLQLDVDSLQLSTFDKDLQSKVVNYITATVKHEISDADANESDMQWFLDFDLAILGEESSIYRQYAVNIRKEYVHIESP
eukprot:CAMPEP_0202701172 /NCGR_PEP_ID=MMETSP1385-20130828/14280_1 /ASSEMBLY_ACC=CAM_ASM_000861 /TAXON_ID=933848 /ORGANISM="Elphidium margaritaceum" /LENGTH=141 /DNA_ID=CAMNT_0049358529 /DNA_START=14 /DNA_END=435 /DNA_ORIENTATION=+